MQRAHTTRYCIARIDHRNTHGWQVKVRRRGRAVNKMFSDGRHGGKARALREAQVFRDSVLARMKPYSRVEMAQISSIRNRSGIVGVRRVEKTRVKGGKAYTGHFWEASWTPEPGASGRRLFSVSKFGERTAKRLAVDARRKGLREMARWHRRNGVS